MQFGVHHLGDFALTAPPAAMAAPRIQHGHRAISIRMALPAQGMPGFLMRLMRVGHGPGP